MFDNPGNKLQVFAFVLFILSIIGSVILIFTTSYWFILGLLVSYLEYLLIYGFGELLINTSEEKKAIDELNKTISEFIKKTEANDNRGEKKQSSQPSKPNYKAEPEQESAPQEETIERPRLGKGDPVVPKPAGDDKIICPVCGTKQRANRMLCMNCAVPFIKFSQK